MLEYEYQMIRGKTVSGDYLYTFQYKKVVALNPVVQLNQQSFLNNTLSICRSEFYHFLTITLNNVQLVII